MKVTERAKLAEEKLRKNSKTWFKNKQKKPVRLDSSDLSHHDPYKVPSVKYPTSVEHSVVMKL